MRRTLREVEPPRPSTRLKQTRSSPPGASPQSQTENRQSQIDPDLDWIVMKCLEKDRSRRYETANGLAADLQRHLANEPVSARPPSAVYRLRKMVRRNKLAFIASAILVLALVGGIVATSWQAIRANRERARAERRLTATLSFVESVFFKVSQKLQNLIGGAEANQVLNENGFVLMQALQREAGGNPQFDLALGKLYTQVAFGEGWFAGNTSGNYDLAFNAATQAVHLFTQLGNAVPQDERANRLARAEMVAGYAAKGLRRFDDSLAHFLEMDRWAKLLAQSSNPDLAVEGAKLHRWAMGSMGGTLEALGQSERALREYYLPFLEELQSRNVSDHSTNWLDLHDLAAVSRSLGQTYNVVGQFEEAARYLRQAHHVLGVLRRMLPNTAQYAAEHPLAEAELGRFLLSRGSDEGLEHLRAATNSIERLVEQDRPNVSFAEHRIKIVRLCALGFADWSADASVPLAERQKRAETAQQHLDRAEALLKSVPTQSLRDARGTELEEARARVAAARAKLGPSDAASSATSRGVK